MDDWFRRAIGRPWLSVAIDIASRCVVAIYAIGVEADWPMHGLPKVLHLDNAAEFKSRAPRTGCGQTASSSCTGPSAGPSSAGMSSA